MAERIRGLAGHYSRLPAQRRLEVGRALLLAGRQEYRVDTWVQGVLRDSVFQGFFAERRTGHPHHANRECAVGPADPLFERRGNPCARSCVEIIYTRSHGGGAGGLASAV